MFVAFALLLIFVFFAALMYLNRLPALIALPVMAVLIGFFAGVPPKDIASYIISDGAMRLNAAIITVLFGSMLSQFVSNSGIAADLIKKVAELAGDNPFRVCLVMSLTVALLFTVLGGLGSVIMVASIVFPILLSIGVTPITAGSLFLLGLSFGGLFNLANWQLYISVLGLSQPQIMGFAVVLASGFFAVLLIFLLKEVGVKFEAKKTVLYLAAAAVLCASIYLLFVGGQLQAALRVVKAALMTDWVKYAALFFTFVFVLAFVADMLKTSLKLAKGQESSPKISVFAVLTPIVPIVLILCFAIYNLIFKPVHAFDFPIIAAIALGLVWGFFATLRKDSIKLLSRSILEGVGLVGPAIALIMGIGMVLNAVTHPLVTGAVSPLLLNIVPSSPVPYVIFFASLAPLALYRGPLNIWGMGAGLIGLLLSSKVLSPAAIMAALMSVGQLQGVCDPTNTHNVWIANNLNINVQDILKKTIVYMWLLALAGLIAAGALYF